MALVEMAQVPEAFVEVTVCSSEGQRSLVGRRQRVLYKNTMQENSVTMLGGFPVHTTELLTRLERGEEAWVPDLQSSDESADEGPVKPTLKRLPKGGTWWGRYRSPTTYPSSDSSNSDDELESEAEEEKPQCGGQRLMVFHRNLLASSRGNGPQYLKVKDTYKNGPQLKKHPRNQAGVVGESSKERTTAGDHQTTCSECGQSFKSKLSLSNHWRKHTREKPYQCSCCGETFAAKKVLAAHQMCHAEEKGYKYPSGMKTSTKLQIVHSEKKPYKCTQCEKSFKVKDRLVRHEKIHSRERPHKCPTCGKGFNRRQHLIRHQQIHERQKNSRSPKTVKETRVESSPLAPKKKPSVDPERTVTLNTRHQRFSVNRYKCQFCGRCMRAKTLLVDHERSHREERRYKCSHCNKSFYHKYPFEKHKRIHQKRQPDCRSPNRMKQPIAKSSLSDSGNFRTAENSSKNPVDRKIITRSFHLAQRLTQNKVFKCQYCGKCMSRSSSLINHVRIHRRKRLYKCQDCGEGFRQKHHLDRHLVTHTSGKPLKRSKNVRRMNVKRSLPVPGGISAGQKPCKDLIHERIVTRSSRFTRQPKIHTEDKPYKCKFCGKVMQTKNSLLSHEKTHKGAKPYICLECGERFSQKNYLGSHQRTHMRKKPYKCLDSEKSLTTKNASLSYGSPQKRKPPYLCLKCGKSFVENYYLMRHQRIHTGAKPFKCATCGKGFIQVWHLKRHERIHLNGRNRKWPAEPEESQLFPIAANGISSGRKDQKDPPVNISGQVTPRTGERNTSPSLKVAKMELLEALEGFEVGVSPGPEQGKMPTEAETERQALLSRKNDRKQQNHCEVKVIGQFLQPRRGRAGKGSAPLHNKQSKNDQPTKCSEKINLEGLKNKKVQAGQPLEPQANSVRKSKRETQMTGKKCRSCFCQQEEPGMTPGRKSKNSVTCMKAVTAISPQREPPVNVSSDMSKRAPKRCKSIKACPDQQSQLMFSGESKMEADENPVLGTSACVEKKEVLEKRVYGNLVSQSCITEKSEAVDISEYQTLSRLPENNVENSCPQIQATKELRSTAVQNLGTASANWQLEAQLTSLKTVGKLTPQRKARAKDNQQERSVEREPEPSAAEVDVAAVTGGRSKKSLFKHVCTKCKKAFRSQANLSIHEKHHTGHRPFQCTQCAKSFFVLTALNVHMRIHTGDKPYKCSECPFLCNVSSNLSRHKRTHTRQRPHACQLCDKRFWLRHSLLAHLKTHSDKEPYKCSDCGRLFPQMNFLKLHRRFKHSLEATEGPEGEQPPHSPEEA